MRDLGLSVLSLINGDTLVHTDLRDDNVIVGNDGTVWVCDWNWPTRGPIWADTLTLTISMVGDGLDGDQLLVRSGLVGDADSEAVDGLLALLLAYFITAGHGEPIEASPYLRPYQIWYAGAITRWLRQRRRW